MSAHSAPTKARGRPRRDPQPVRGRVGAADGTIGAASAGNGADTRQRIEEAALRLFYEQGSNATTVRDVTARCGLTPGALYNHFASKEALLYSIVLRAHTELVDELERANGSASDPRERLAALVRAFVRFHALHRHESRVASRDYEYLTGDWLHEVMRLRTESGLFFKNVLDDGAAAGVFRLIRSPKPKVEASVVAGSAIVDMCIRVAEPYWSKSGLTVDEVADLHTALALRMAGGNPE